ncbi:MAG: 3-deoxy-D-manno-octulosonic acid transferase [Tangfeifania sp.]
MTFLYTTGIYFYTLISHLLSPFNTKARQFVKGRKNWSGKLTRQIETNARYIWVHCASLGEFEQGRPLIEAIKERHPEYRIILTFFSPSGYEIRKNYPLADIISYLPVDTPKNARKFIRITNPEKAFFVKYEYWYFYISELKKQNIPLYQVSAIFRESQLFFKENRWGKWYRELLHQFTHFFVQDKKSEELLASIGITNVSLAGDTRFDRVAAIAAGAKKLPLVEKFRGDSSLIVAGSTWKPDEEMLAAFINNGAYIKMIIAPHEVSATNINRLQQMLKTPSVLYSAAENEDLAAKQVLIIDSVGLLSSLYRYGDAAYIGGGFGVGIHNILEAATFGLPVIFGPNYQKFKEAVDLIKKGGAFTIKDFAELKAVLEKLLSNKKFLEKASAVNKEYVDENVGATFLIIKKVFNK